MIAAVGGLTYTALFHGRPDRDACEEGAQAFIERLAKDCPQCVVQEATCARRAHEPSGASYWVVGRAIRIAIAGPEENAHASCELTARALEGRCERRNSRPLQ